MKGVLVRRWSTIIGAVIIAGSFMLSKKLASMEEDPKKKESTLVHPRIKVLEVNNKTVPVAIEIDGRVNSTGRIDVYSEVTGKLIGQNKLFKEGTEFRKGEILMRINDNDFRLNLAASRSAFQSQITQLLADISIDYPEDLDKWQNYVEQFDSKKSLSSLPEIENKQEKNFLVSRNIYNQFFAIKSQEAQLAKYTIYAPFNGIVSNANVNPGTIIRAGQKIGEFIGTSGFELQVGVNKRDLNFLSIGNKVNLLSSDSEVPLEGVVKRISESMDPSTQSFKIYIDVSDGDIYEGMYLEGTILGKEITDVFEVDNYLMINDKSIYTINVDADEGTKLKSQTVEMVFQNSESTLLKGLNNKSLIANQIVPGAKDGLMVQLIEE